VLDALINRYSNRRSESLSANQLKRLNLSRRGVLYAYRGRFSCSSGVTLRCGWSAGPSATLEHA